MQPRALCSSFPGAAALALFSLLPLAAAVAQSPASVPDEVVVLAKKRQQVATDVDVAVKVLEPEALQALNFRSLPQAAALVENVALFEDFAGAAIPTWVIRGVGLQDFNSNNSPTAAVYLDGAYQVATVMGAASLFDVADLEILKGPQGGLYGRNTTGGAVLLNSRRAVLGRREASLDLGYGSWNTSLAQGAYNLPVGDASALRVAFNLENSRDGWQHSLTERGMQGDREKLDLRTWWRHDFSPRTRVEWKLQGGRDDSDIPLGRSLGVYDPSGNGEFCAPVLAGRRDESECINWAGVNRVADGSGVPENLLAQSDDGKRVLSQLMNRQANDYMGSVLEWHWQGRHADFLSLTSFDRFDYGVMLDLDGSAGEYGHRYSSSDLRTWSQEFRLSAPAQNRVYWLAGLSVSGEEFAEHRDFRLADNHIVRLGRGILEYDQHTRSVSAYADMEWPFAERLALTGGLRWTDENKRYRNGNFWMPRETPIYLARDLAADYSLDDQFAGSLGLKWHPTDDALVYVKYSSASKAAASTAAFPSTRWRWNPIARKPLMPGRRG
ncbi:MAG TPA: TonB-dependent receptor [Hyphomicrobiales bacterium]|nr:TonB-dependent receptor [Hyphomicrobiales bacterium]